MAADGHSALVLIVDDSRFDRELAREALESHARVECCTSAEEALEIARREQVDLVLSDLSMPGLSGLDLLGELDLLLRREQVVFADRGEILADQIGGQAPSLVGQLRKFAQGTGPCALGERGGPCPATSCLHFALPPHSA